MSMTHRERVLAALDHRETDRVPVDFGGTIVTTIETGAYGRLKKHLGLDGEAEKTGDEGMLLGAVRLTTLAIPEEPVLRRFDVDTRYLGLGDYEGGGKRAIDADNFLDEWGTTWSKTGGGHYLFVDGPFYGKKRPTVADLEGHDWPDPSNPGYYRSLGERARELRRETDAAIILNLPSGVVLQGLFVRGFGDWHKDLHRNRDFVGRLSEIIADIWIGLARRALDVVGDNVDLVFFGDDLAGQEGPLFSPEIYEELIKPHHERMIGAVKERGDYKLLFHTCGAAYRFVDHLIDIGVDALNPVQVSARDMEPGRLKEEFGDRIAFWGGINTQDVLPFGTPEEVRTEVRRMIDCLGPGGGYVLNSVHNIQKEVPPENIAAMFDEARTYRAR